MHALTNILVDVDATVAAHPALERAERILHTVPCSVLAVKPEGFESPVRLDPA